MTFRLGLGPRPASPRIDWPKPWPRLSEVASGEGLNCVCPTMNASDICDPEVARATGWLHRALFGVLAATALFSLVVAFAVEFAAVVS